MLKRLIIAVFGISLIIALGSIALAGPKVDVPDGTDAPDAFLPNHPRFNQVVTYIPPQPAFKKPESALHALPPGTPAPSAPSPTYFCDLQSYAGAPFGYFTIPDAYGDNYFNTRFTVDAVFDCTLKVAHFLMYEPPTTGAPSFRAYLWADDGFGFPGALLDSVTIPFASVAAAYAASAGTSAYLSANFSAAGWVFTLGDSYHYGWSTIGGGTLACISDNGAGPFAGEERSSEFFSGAWGSMLNDWGGGVNDYTFVTYSERCCNEITFSDCYSQYYFGAGPVSLWTTPNHTFGDSAWAERFTVGGPETLYSVEFGVSSTAYPVSLDPAGNNNINVSVYADNGSGRPGALLAQETVLAGSYGFYPALHSVAMSPPVVLTNTFHIALSTNGVAGASGETFVSDAPAVASDRGSVCFSTGVWSSMISGWGVNVDFAIRANLCRDALPLCTIQNWTGGVVDDSRAIPDGNPILEWAQSFFGNGAECNVHELTMHFVRLAADITAGRNGMYTYNTEIRLRSDVGGYPGGIFHTIVLTPADYAAAGYTGPAFVGNLFITRALSVAVPTKFWVSVRSLSDTITVAQPPFNLNNTRRANGIRHASNLFTGGGGNPFGFAGFFGGIWDYSDDIFGLPGDYEGALDLTAGVCCSPFDERVCAPAGDDWSARSHDQARTGASQLSIGDAWCDLTRDWFADDLNAAATALTMGPIIYNNRVYQVLETAAAGSSIRVFNLTTGALLGTISGAALGNFAENDPLIVGGKLYISGGDNRIVSRWDISAGVPALPDWTRTLSGAAGPIRRANLLMLNIAGTNVLYGGTQIGRAFAIKESDGLDYAGWATNPITLDAGQLVQGSATDGSKLFFGTRQAGLNGDVWAINPATGAVVWKYSTAGGYRGLSSGIYTNVTSEAFPQISYDGGVLFVGGRETGTFPTDGLFYRIDAATGDFLSVTQSVGNLFANPIIDNDRVYILSTTAWLPTNLGVDLYAYNKHNGAFSWLSEYTYEEGALARYFNNGALTCEPAPQGDIIISADEKGHVFFNNSSDGEQLFRRRMDFGPGGNTSTTGGIAIGTDSLGAVHVLVGSNRGALASLKKGGADRARIEIQDYDPTLPVEFSLLTSVVYTVEDILTNSGCANLTISAVNVDDVSFGMTDPGIAPFVPVRPGLLDIAAELASRMASGAQMFKDYNAVNEIGAGVNDQLLSSSEESNRSERGYRAALAFPAYINSVTSPFAGQVVAPGDSIDLVIDVNPTLIERGPQTFYVELVSNDPDYFLNAGSVTLPNADPMLIVTFIGGCLTDTTALEFGVGGANYQWVTNTGRLADGDWTAHGMEIDGQDALMYQGSYIFGVSTERIAFNSADWSGTTGQEASWISIQGDPNYCDNTCKPALFTGVNLGAIWNGASYTPILGNLVCKSWIDSVQDFGYGVFADWDWKAFGAPFDDTLTMGVKANTRTVGALNTAGLTNLTVEIFEVTENNGDSVPGWKFGVNIDYDVATSLGGVADTSFLDRNISAAWTSSAQSLTAHYAWGFIKLPFGCGQTPIKNAKGLDASQGHFIALGGLARGDGYMDSAYTYMSAPIGNSSHSVSAAPDQQIHGTLVEKSFGPNETLTFGVAQFGFNSGVTNPRLPGGGGEIATLANTANKWIGFGRGDVNNDNAVNLGDIMMLADIVGGSVPGAIPFAHLADVDANDLVNNADLNYLINYYFDCGPCPLGEWQF